METIDKEVIEGYIDTCYLFTSTDQQFVVRDKVTGVNLIYTIFIRKLQKIFPKMMGIVPIATHWWASHVSNVKKIADSVLDNYHLEIGDQIKAWDVVNAEGKKFNINELIDIIPSHHSYNHVVALYDEWLEDKKIIATERLMGMRS